MKFHCPNLSFHMRPEVTGHVGVHVAKTVKGAKGQVKEEATHKGEVPPYLKMWASTNKVFKIFPNGKKAVFSSPAF